MRGTALGLPPSDIPGSHRETPLIVSIRGDDSALPLTRREGATTSPHKEWGEVKGSAYLLALPTRNPCLTLPANDGARRGTTVE